MKQHEIKVQPPFYQHLMDGTKTFELRKNDRQYMRGDQLLLREWEEGRGYTGRERIAKITYILRHEDIAHLARYAIAPGWVIMAIELRM